MKMDDMNKYLMDRGFNVLRHYTCDGETYLFRISKDDYTLTYEFKYPRDSRERDTLQREFLRHIVDEFYVLKNKHFGNASVTSPSVNPMTIKDVIFNPPATIVFWEDGTKTVVKDQGEECFDPEKGLAMAISKKALGNKGNYYNQFSKWCGKYDVEPIYPNMPSIEFPMANELKKAIESIVNRRFESVIAAKQTKKD